MRLMVYVPVLTPRVKYIFNFIFNEILKTEVGFSTDIREFVQSDLPKFCYATQPIAGELFFKSTNLLLEHKITDQQIDTTIFGEIKVPFTVEKGELPFDVFAASFYFLSRYEEYLSAHHPKNERYPAELSLQYKLALLKLPIIDGWALILKNILLKHFPSLSFDPKHFLFYPVQYIDAAAKTFNKNIITSTIDYIRGFIDNKITRNEEKLAEIRQMVAEMQQYGLLHGTQLVISSSNQSHADAEIQIPKSYVKLIKYSMETDYSMYYDNYPGFRAGTCTPFHWYDLQIEKKTQLRVHPIAATDRVLLRNKNREELLLHMNELIDSVKLVNGSFYFLSLDHDIRPQ